MANTLIDVSQLPVITPNPNTDYSLAVQSLGNQMFQAVQIPIKAPGVVLLGVKIGFNMNSIADQVITLNGGTKFIITDVVVTNASINMTTADDLMINDTVSRGGSVIAHANNAHGNAISGLSTPNQFINNGNNGGNLLFYQFNRQGVSVGNTLYASLLTPQGATATADIYVYGYILN
jgi:hypothetical protein